jgi:hypothetical protein
MLRMKNWSALAQGAGLALFGLAIAGASIAGWCHWQHHFWTAQRGPTEVALADLAKIQRPEQLPSTWVRVKFDKAYDTKRGVEEVEGGSRTIIEKYLLVQVGDRWLIAVVPGKFHGNVLAGQVWHANSQQNNEAFVAIHKEFQDLHQGRLFPFEFHAETDYGENWTYFAVVMAMFGAAGLFFSLLGAGSVVHWLRSRAPISEAELNEKASAQVDDAIARIMASAGIERRT